MKKIMEILDIKTDALPKAFILMETMLGLDCIARGWDYQWESSIITNWTIRTSFLPRYMWGILLIITGLGIFTGMFSQIRQITAAAHFAAFFLYLILSVLLINQGTLHDPHHMRTLFDMICVSLGNLIFYIVKLAVIKQNKIDANQDKKTMKTKLTQVIVQRSNS